MHNLTIDDRTITGKMTGKIGLIGLMGPISTPVLWEHTDTMPEVTIPLTFAFQINSASRVYKRRLPRGMEQRKNML